MKAVRERTNWIDEIDGKDNSAQKRTPDLLINKESEETGRKLRRPHA
jgi:hypothetical protein